MIKTLIKHLNILIFEYKTMTHKKLVNLTSTNEEYVRLAIEKELY